MKQRKNLKTLQQDQQLLPSNEFTQKENSFIEFKSKGSRLWQLMVYF